MMMSGTSGEGMEETGAMREIEMNERKIEEINRLLGRR